MLQKLKRQRRRHDSGSDSEESDSDDLKPAIKLDFKRIKLFVILKSVLLLEGQDILPAGYFRAGNKKRDRVGILRWAAELDDKMFRRQFRLHREDFFYVLLKISGDLSKNERQARNSSGSSITPELKLMISLRILAGASYLDMIHYRVHVDSVSNIVWETVKAIHSNIDNIRLASTEEECLKVAKVWAAIQLVRWGEHLTAGTIYAGDGLAVEIGQPSVAELRGRPISIFRNRKGFWALIAQGFCDANTRFAVFDVKWPGNTNDIIAYNMSDVCNKAMTGFFPPWATFVLDEAYSSCGGMHLTPFSIHQLKRAKRNERALYFKMLSFNNILSSQRITIERAFGILVRRWGILWKPITFQLNKIATIVRACAMLHNICVDRWLLSKPRSYVNKVRQWPDVPGQEFVEDPMPEDESIIERLHNNYTCSRALSVDNSLRMQLLEDIFNAGIVATSDTEFHQLD
jgi:DDE superfamily endonuclease